MFEKNCQRHKHDSMISATEIVQRRSSSCTYYLVALSARHVFHELEGFRTNHFLRLLILGDNLGENSVRVIVLSADVADVGMDAFIIQKKAFQFARNRTFQLSVHDPLDDVLWFV